MSQSACVAQVLSFETKSATEKLPVNCRQLERRWLGPPE